MAFDLARFRDLAFARAPLPDHPMQTEEEAKKLIGLLPDNDPGHALAELTQWTASLNATSEFTPGRRARILQLLDDASRVLWRELGQQYLAPAGAPIEAMDGDAAILRAMADSASEFANGLAIVLDTGEEGSKLVAENYALLSGRTLRWLGRRLALTYMLQGAHATAIWERLHRRFRLAVARGVVRDMFPAHRGAHYNSSTQIEYVRALLLELAHPDALRPRDIELVYRIAARAAPAVRLETERSDEANFAVVALADGRPNKAALLKKKAEAPWYIATANCLQRLRGLLERDLGRDPAEEDTLFGRGFTIRERNAMVKRVLEHWGLDPPVRRAQRVPMAAPARVLGGFENVVTVIPALDKGTPGDAAAARRELQLKLDQTSKTLSRAKLRAGRVGAARVIDASAGGLGVAIKRADAPWASHGALLAIKIEPGNDWFLGVLRRIFSIEDELRLGVQILAARPHVVALRTETVKRDEVWEEAMRFEATFKEHYQRGILCEAQRLPLKGGEMLLTPKLGGRGTQFNIPLAQGGEQRIRIERLLENTLHYQRVVFESLGDKH
ncbi:MAG TPA: hypothetical protein VN747_09725 [Burkholderiales bacterium]|nr:hypothetical protein [Burkholderiales bacterium]